METQETLTPRTWHPPGNARELTDIRGIQRKLPPSCTPHSGARGGSSCNSARTHLPVPRREQESAPCREEDTKTARGACRSPGQDRGRAGTPPGVGGGQARAGGQGHGERLPVLPESESEPSPPRPPHRQGKQLGATGARPSRGPHRGSPSARREQTTVQTKLC